MHRHRQMQPARPTTAVASPESLGGVYTNYSKWVRYGMIFGGFILVDGRWGVELDLLRSSFFLGDALPTTGFTPVCAKAPSDTSYSTRHSKPI